MLKKLIIVDDDTPFRERLARSMEKKGFFVETFANYKDCLKRCIEQSFDYAVVDMRLEDGSGLELIKKIKEISPKTKSLLLTGYGNIATAVAAIKTGAIDYLPKPAEIDQIYDALTNSDEFQSWLNSMLGDHTRCMELGKRSKEYVEGQAGASERCLPLLVC